MNLKIFYLYKISMKPNTKNTFYGTTGGTCRNHGNEVVYKKLVKKKFLTTHVFVERRFQTLNQ